jgi:hypothetical protein
MTIDVMTFETTFALGLHTRQASNGPEMICTNFIDYNIKFKNEQKKNYNFAKQILFTTITNRPTIAVQRRVVYII